MYKAQQGAGGEAGPAPGGEAGGGPGAGSGQTGGKPDDKVVDADFEEVDDQKKNRA
jgi:molecular chaperone DnaK